MARLTQLSNTAAFYIGWYGTCENDGTEQCDPFELINDNSGVLSHAHDNIRDIKMVSANREGLLGYSGAASSFFLKFQTIRRLECGKCYQITMKPGSGDLDIPEFTFANAQNDDPDQDLNNRITNRCYSPPPPPVSQTPTPTTTSTPTPTPTQDPTPTPTTTPTPTPTTPLADKCEGYNTGTDVGEATVVHEQVRFWNFPEGGHVCFGGATGGNPGPDSMVRINGIPTPEGRMQVNGSLLNNGIKYIDKNGNVYTGTFRNNGVFTDLT